MGWLIIALLIIVPIICGASIYRLQDQIDRQLTPTKESTMQFELGTKAKDKITGFQGVITGRVQYLTGCDQYLIQPECGSDGKYPDSYWIDENRIDLVDATVMEIDTSTVNGPCGAAPKY